MSRGKATGDFSGTVVAVVFANTEESYYVLKINLDKPDDGFDMGFSEAITVTGYVPGLHIDRGSWFGFEAKWETHETYGRQLRISRAPVLKGGWNAQTAIKLLAGSGVAESILQRVKKEAVDDDEFLTILANEEALAKVPGINKFTAHYISSRWQSARAYFQAVAFLNNLELPSSTIRQIWTEFGDQAEKVLSTNPWRLVWIDGIKFNIADGIALQLDLEFDCRERIEAAAFFSSRNHSGMGHLFTTIAELFEDVRKIVPGVKAAQLAPALVSLHKTGDLYIDQKTKKGTKAIYKPWFYLMEKDGAEMLAARQVTADLTADPKRLVKYLQGFSGVGPQSQALSSSKPLVEVLPENAEGLAETPPVGLDSHFETVARTAIDDWAKGTTFVLSENQKQGIFNALTSPVSIITGLPGTGKTTSLRALVRIFQDVGVYPLLMAPTGIAAKRIKEVTGAEAFTIHRAFGAKGGQDGKERKSVYAGIVGQSEGLQASEDGGFWEFGPGYPHSASVVIVDESSMLDQHLLYRVLNCTSDTCRLVFVGDAAQLPSVGPGNVLRDMVNSKLFPTVNLTEIFRQDEASQIIFAAHDIHAGLLPDTSVSKEFTLIQRDTDDRVLETLLKLAVTMRSRDYDFQVLSPKHGGKVGVTNLNERLRELLNPQHKGTRELKLPGDMGTIREGDRVMVVKNNYDLGVFNGDVGSVVGVDAKGKGITVKIHGPRPLLVILDYRTVISHLRLAYACTVHKMQGLEADRILMPIVSSFAHQLQRNLFYTAVTRAKKQVVLVGSTKALERAVRNDQEDLRNTLFHQRLERNVLDPAPALRRLANRRAEAKAESDGDDPTRASEKDAGPVTSFSIVEEMKTDAWLDGALDLD